MKTTLDLPERLLHELQRRAASQGRDVNDLVAEILTADVVPGITDIRLVPKTLPRIKVRPVQQPNGHALSTQEWCDWLKEVDLQLEVERYEKALGHQHVDRSDG
jgi:plasmid stability protein